MIGAWSAETFAAYRAAPDGPRKRFLANQLYLENEPLVKTLVAQMIGTGEIRAGRRIPAALRRIHRSEHVESWEDAMGVAGIAFAKFLTDYDPSKGKISYFLGLKIKYELQCLIERSENLKIPRDYEADCLPRGFERFEVDGDLERAMSSSGLEISEVDDFEEVDEREVRRVEVAIAEVPARPPLSAIDDFLERGCAWAASARVARGPLVATFERHALALGLAPLVAPMLRAVVARGARRVRLRTSWSAAARGFAGVRLQSVAA